MKKKIKNKKPFDKFVAILDKNFKIYDITEVTHYIQYLTNQKSDRYERTNFLS